MNEDRLAKAIDRLAAAVERLTQTTITATGGEPPELCMRCNGRGHWAPGVLCETCGGSGHR